jgi:PBP1b-binding outer membrane lipoprotein LpoB
VIKLKKIYLITGIILILSLLLSGCANRPQDDPDQDMGKEDATKVVATEPDQPDEVTTMSTLSNVSSITQEDLDKLKADIENLEAEDLGGLSND